MHVVSFFHSLWGHAWLDNAMVAIATYGLAISVAASLFGFVRQRPRGLLPWVVAGAAAAVGLDLLSAHLIFDPRPFVILNITPLFAHSTDNGFPSDHSVVAAFVAALLWFIDAPAATIATLAAVVIGIARVYALVHWPIDVIGGWFIGAIPATIAMLLWKRHHG
jgi:membrane-associated phospholipid phosphatase